MIEEVTNVARAAWAKKALQTFANATGLDMKEDGIDTVMGDLLCNLRHLCDVGGFDFKDIDNRSYATYREEFSEELELDGNQEGENK